MCLATKMSEKKQQQFISQEEGYKVFRERGGQLFGECFARRKPREIEKWLNADLYLFHSLIFYGRRQDCYEPGWHIWLTEKGAQHWLMKSTRDAVMRKVQFKEPIVYGWQGKYPVVVAQEVYILPEGEDDGSRDQATSEQH